MGARGGLEGRPLEWVFLLNLSWGPGRNLPSLLVDALHDLHAPQADLISGADLHPDLLGELQQLLLRSLSLDVYLQTHLFIQ